LPLHGGRVPAWLGQRMARLGAVIGEAIVHHYGRDEFAMKSWPKTPIHIQHNFAFARDLHPSENTERLSPSPPLAAASFALAHEALRQGTIYDR
jgi:hypothetical protein